MLTPPNSFVWRLIAIAGLLCCVVLLCTLYISYRHIAPFWDMVAVYELLQKHAESSAGELLRAIIAFQDNEHNAYVPFFIWWLDWKLYDSLGLLPQLCIFGCSSFLAHQCTEWSRLASTNRIIAWLLGWLMLLSPWHFANLIWDKQIHVYTSLSLAVLAIMTVTGVRQTIQNPWPSVLLSSFIALLASFSFAYGVAVWPPLVAYIFSRHGAKPAMLTALVGASVVAYYWLTLPTNPAVYEKNLSLGTFFGYTFNFLGPHIFLPTELPILERVIGAMSFVVVTVAAWSAYVKQDPLRPAQHLSLLICITCIGIALLSAFGRASLNAGTSSRYLIVVAIFYISLPGVVSIHSLKLLARTATKYFLVSAVFLSLLCSGSSIVGLWHVSARLRDAASAATVGIPPSMVGNNFHRTQFQEVAWPDYLESHKNRGDLYHFTHLGDALQSLIESGELESVTDCTGGISDISRDPQYINGWHVDGWALNLRSASWKPRWVVAADDTTRIIGFGTTGLPLPDFIPRTNEIWETGKWWEKRVNLSWRNLSWYIQEATYTTADRHQAMFQLPANLQSTLESRDITNLMPLVFSGMTAHLLQPTAPRTLFYLIDRETICNFAEIELPLVDD